MCLYKKQITNKYTGKKMYVKCGKCPACQQEKAERRKARIRNHVGKKDIALFVTLTYTNDCIPYIRKSELYNYNDDYSVDLNVYRDCSVNWLRHGDVFRRTRRYDTKVLTTVNVPFDCHSDINLKPLYNGDSDKVSVIYYKDVQDYIKRVRRKLNYNNYDFPISFFSCAEYGPTHGRAHFHLLVFVPVGFYQVTKNALAACWSFDDYLRTYRNIEIAKNAASYVSSYINCSNHVPPLFNDVREFRQKSSHSKNFGFAKNEFSLPSVIRSFYQEDLRIDCATNSNGLLAVSRVLYPKYVINYWFPKFNGFGRLAPDEISLVSKEPFRLYSYAYRIGIYDKSVVDRIVTFLTNRLDKVKSLGVSVDDYAFCYAYIWQRYNSELLKDFYNTPIFDKSEWLQMYDNILDLYTNDVYNGSLQDILDASDLVHYETDPNKFTSNIIEDKYYTELFCKKDKSKKIRNQIMSNKLSYVYG